MFLLISAVVAARHSLGDRCLWTMSDQLCLSGSSELDDRVSMILRNESIPFSEHGLIVLYKKIAPVGPTTFVEIELLE